MGTRSITLFREWDGPYIPHYRHMDGYPTALGLELINCLKKGYTEEQIIEECGLTPPGKDGIFRNHHALAKPEDAFKIQGDLDYIYVVGDLSRQYTTSLEIYRTSNPYDLPPFVFLLWTSYVKFFPDDPVHTMKDIERDGAITLKALVAYHEALKE